MEERDQGDGAVRVGMIWGGIGGVVSFLVSLFGSLVGILVAGFVGYSCGRRAAESGQRTGGLSGLIGGAVAAPGYLLGSALGAFVAVREIGASRLSATLSDMLGTRVTPDEAWLFFLLSLALAAFLQATVLILASTAAGAWTKR